jgi:hypothetical protein
MSDRTAVRTNTRNASKSLHKKIKEDLKGFDIEVLRIGDNSFQIWEGRKYLCTLTATNEGMWYCSHDSINGRGDPNLWQKPSGALDWYRIREFQVYGNREK